MIIAERQLDGASFTRSSRDGIGVAEKPPQKDLFVERDIFASSSGVLLTDRGQKIQKILIIADSLENPRLSLEKRGEIMQELKRTCGEVEVDIHDYQEIRTQFKRLVEERSSKIDIQYPTSQNLSLEKSERKSRFPLKGLLINLSNVSKILTIGQK